MVFIFAFGLFIGLAQQAEVGAVKPDELLREIRVQARKTYLLYNNMNINGALELTRKTGEILRYSIDYSGNGPLQSYQFSIIQERDGEKVYLDRVILAASPEDHYVCRRTGAERKLLY